MRHGVAIAMWAGQHGPAVLDETENRMTEYGKAFVMFHGFTTIDQVVVEPAITKMEDREFRVRLGSLSMNLTRAALSSLVTQGEFALREADDEGLPPLEFVALFDPAPFEKCEPHSWHNGFTWLSTGRDDAPADGVMRRYCRDCAVTFESLTARSLKEAERNG